MMAGSGALACVLLLCVSFQLLLIFPYYVV
jgi:hypothetical protein